MKRLSNGDRQPSATKRGPGRYHEEGHKKARPTVQKGGAWLGQVTNPRKAEWKQLKADRGARQAKKFVKRFRRQQAEALAQAREVAEARS